MSALFDAYWRSNGNGNGNGNGRAPIAATYRYVDEDERLLFEVVRREDKTFAQRRPDGLGGWVWKLGDTRRVLYRLPAVIAAVDAGQDVYVVEGEKDVHAIEQAGAVATCNPAGAGKWRPEYGEVLRGARVVVVADRDEPGYRHAQHVAASLEGIAATVRIAQAAEGKDAYDHLSAGRELGDFEPVEQPDGTGVERSQPDVTFDAKGKLVLPDVPADTDFAGQCAWLTSVFNLNAENPITAGVWQGVLGPDGQIVLRRAGAKDLRFEPARAMNAPMRLIESFVGRKHPGDGMLHPFKAEHCRQISHVVQCLCDTSEAQTEEQEAVGIVGAFLQIATAIEELTTFGTTAQRYEAAHALRSDADGPRYLIDANTGEIVIPVGELAERARKTVGSSLPRGWLDARMANLGWNRARLDGHAEAGRNGRAGPHATVNVYRGLLPAVTK